MNKINPYFAIPHYIFEEIIDYIEETAKGKCKCMKWTNIRRLLKLAIANNHLTQQQADFLINKYSREK